SFLDKLKELFRLKASQIKLSSRGDCDQREMDDYLKTDAVINDKILLIDSLCLPVDKTSETVPVSYFLQWKNNGIIVNKSIRYVNGKIIITPADLTFDTIPYNEDENPVSLGIIRYR